MRQHETRSRVELSVEVLHQRQLLVQPARNGARMYKRCRGDFLVLADVHSASIHDATTFRPTRAGVRAGTTSEAERCVAAEGCADAFAGARTTAGIDARKSKGKHGSMKERMNGVVSPNMKQALCKPGPDTQPPEVRPWHGGCSTATPACMPATTPLRQHQRCIGWIVIQLCVP